MICCAVLTWVWTAKENRDRRAKFHWLFVKGRRQVTAYYFYIFDPDFGPGSIKITSPH